MLWRAHIEVVGRTRIGDIRRCGWGTLRRAWTEEGDDTVLGSAFGAGLIRHRKGR
jgi:hypothetical protein